MTVPLIALAGAAGVLSRCRALALVAPWVVLGVAAAAAGWTLVGRRT